MSKEAILNDELEEFNEAPHVVNSYVRRPIVNNWYNPANYNYSDNPDGGGRGGGGVGGGGAEGGNTLQNLNYQYPHQRFNSVNQSAINDDYCNAKDNVPLIIT